MSTFTTARSFVVGCALVALGVFCLAQEPAREKQPAKEAGNQFKPIEKFAPGTDSAEQLWKQIGQLHRQIVMLEMHPTGSASGTAIEPKTQPNAAPTNPDRPENDLFRNQLRPEDALKLAPAGVTATTALSSEALWMQIAQLHKQIVQLEAGETSVRTERAFRGAEEPEKKFGAPATDSKAPAATEPKAPTIERDGTQPTKGADAHQTNVAQLWSRIANLQQQIVALEVKEAKSRTSSPQQPTAPVRENPTPNED